MLFVHGLFCCCGAGLVVEARGRFIGADGQKTRKKRGFGFYASSCRWSVGEVVIRLR